MNIVTTVNIRTDLLDKMKRRKEELHISLNKIVGIILSKALNWNKKSIKTFESVKYQMKDNDARWHKLHISLNNELYERCIDMRKLYKLSVSYILAICIQLYLEILSTELNNFYNTDNYHSCYLFFSSTKDNIFSYTIFWGLPELSTIKDYL